MEKASTDEEKNAANDAAETFITDRYGKLAFDLIKTVDGKLDLKSKDYLDFKDAMNKSNLTLQATI